MTLSTLDSTSPKVLLTEDGLEKELETDTLRLASETDKLEDVTNVLEMIASELEDVTDVLELENDCT